jgi:hypothetical protein
MLSLAEAARLQADGHGRDRTEKRGAGGPSIALNLNGKVMEPRHAKSHPFDYELGKERKRRRTAGGGAVGYVVDTGASTGGAAQTEVPVRGTTVHAYADVVDLGYCTEETGRRLFDLWVRASRTDDRFFQGSLIYMPVYEAKVDTWESLRKRSPFSITTLIMAGAKVEDGGGEWSLPTVVWNAYRQVPWASFRERRGSMQRKLASRLEDWGWQAGMGTLFTPVARIEALQAMSEAIFDLPGRPTRLTE